MYSTILYDAVAVTVVIFVMASTYRAVRKNRLRVKFLTELEEYCLELRHRYGECRVLSDAVFASFDPTRKAVGDFTFGMTRVFGNDRTAGLTVTGFSESLSDPYEKLLLSVCSMVDEYGDNRRGSFGETILKIVIDIREERRHLARRSHGFKGLAATAVIPCLFVRFLGNWGMDTIPSLRAFYHGRGGVWLRSLIPVLALLCAGGIRILADPVNFKERFYGICKRAGSIETPAGIMKGFNERLRTRLEKLDIRVGVGRIRFLSFLTAGAFFVITFAGILLGVADRKYDLRYDTSDVENTLRIADSAQINAAHRVIPFLMENTLEGSMSFSDEELRDVIRDAGIRSEEAVDGVAEEFRGRLLRYEEEGTDLWDVGFVLAMGALGWLAPTISLLILSVVLDSRIKEEVMQFEAVIDMEKDVNGMTVPVMLESMMSFASVTRGALIRTIMDYNTCGTRAFSHLADFGNDRSLKRLAGFFAMTDVLGIGHAFDEISEELDGMREEKRLDRSMRLEDEVMLAGILGVIPGGLVVFGYLLVPFIVRSLEMFNTYSDSLGMM